MNRVEFTYNICQLIIEMFKADEHPIMDFVKRSPEEQHRLWQIGRDANGNKIGDTVTNCDGVKIPSAHQSGKAMDIYFLEDGKLIDPKLGWEYWHKRWTETYKGNEMIEWDRGHFEG
jgi:phenylalanyl-tRNA synthetase alpha subunit